MFHFYTSWKHQKTGFLMFSGSIEAGALVEMVYDQVVLRFLKLWLMRFRKFTAILVLIYKYASLGCTQDPLKDPWLNVLKK